MGLSPVGADIGGEDGALALARGAQDGGAGSVAEEHAGVAVFIVDEGGEFFGPDDEGVLEGAGRDEALGDLHCVDEARAGGGDVEGDRPGGAEVLLDVAGGGGSEGVGGDGGDDDEVEFGGGEAGVLEGPRGGLGRHVGGEFPLGGDAAFLDAGAGGDPLVGGVDQLCQIGIGEDFFGQIAARSGNGDGDLRCGPIHGAE